MNAALFYIDSCLYFLLRVLYVTNTFTPVSQSVLRLAMRKATGNSIPGKDKKLSNKGRRVK